MNHPLIQRHNHTDKQDFYFGLFSDLHIDADDVDRRKMIRDLNEVVEKDGRIFINGDSFDAIFPTDKKRYTRGSDPGEHDAKMNVMVREVADVLRPYANYIDLIGVGNHETSPIKYNNFDPVMALCYDLNRDRDKSLAPIKHGGYRGFIRLVFDNGNKEAVSTYDIFYDHGKGGSASVTKGMIDINRFVYGYNADLYWFGHKHTSIMDDGIRKVGLNRAGKIVVTEHRAVFTAGYKKPFVVHENSYNDTGYMLNYGEERMIQPQADGYALLHINVNNHGMRARVIK